MLAHIRLRPILQPAVGVIHRKRPDHISSKMDGYAVVVAVEEVVHDTSLQAVLERVGDDSHNVVACKVCPAQGVEVPSVASNFDGLLTGLIEVGAVQSQSPGRYHQS